MDCKPTWIRPITGAIIPKNHSQPTAKYPSARMRQTTQPVTSARNAPQHPTSHAGQELRYG